MFDLKDPSRFRHMAKDGFKFGGDYGRNVRLEVLAEKDANLYIKVKGMKVPQYIGTFQGYDVVQFYVGGPWELGSSGPVQVWTGEFDTVAEAIPEAVSFTRIMTRRARNPELDAMMHQVNKNMERRLAQIDRDAKLRDAQVRRELAAERAATDRLRAEAAEREAVARAAENEEEDESAET